MYLISLNCNGIRSAMKKGLGEWIAREDPDLLCLQEIKANIDDIDLDFFSELGYTPTIHSAEKKGYSGTAVFSKKKEYRLEVGMGEVETRNEGRIISLFYSKFILVNAYFPSGTTGDTRQEVKMEFLSQMQTYLDKIRKENKNIILCGDVNIAHTELDIHNPKGNIKNSGFLPEEREWVSKFLESGWVDTFRKVHPESKDAYSWWTYRFQAKKSNKGWRIDYFFVTNPLEKKIEDAGIYPEMDFSDHAPVYLKIKLSL